MQTVKLPNVVQGNFAPLLWPRSIQDALIGDPRRGPEVDDEVQRHVELGICDEEVEPLLEDSVFRIRQLPFRAEKFDEAELRAPQRSLHDLGHLPWTALLAVLLHVGELDVALEEVAIADGVLVHQG